MEEYYEAHHANVHRGVYATAEEATNLYEAPASTSGASSVRPTPDAK